MLFDSVEELETDAELGLKLQNVKSFVFSLEFLKCFQLKVGMNSFDEPVPDVFFDKPFVNLPAQK
jgi:hypothetical protein